MRKLHAAIAIDNSLAKIIGKINENQFLNVKNATKIQVLYCSLLQLIDVTKDVRIKCDFELLLHKMVSSIALSSSR